MRIGLNQPRSQGPPSSSPEKARWLWLVTCLSVQIKSTLNVGPRLNFVNSKIQFYLGKGDTTCFSSSNVAQVALLWAGYRIYSIKHRGVY